MLEENMAELDHFIGKPGEPVPVVEPADLKRLWAYAQELRARYPSGGMATGIDVLKHMCSPGADIRAVSYRSTMLSMLALMLESAWPGGQPSEAAFEVAAQMELTWMDVGVPHRGLPFDVGRFLGEVRGMSLYKDGAGGQEKV